MFRKSGCGVWCEGDGRLQRELEFEPSAEMEQPEGENNFEANKRMETEMPECSFVNEKQIESLTERQKEYFRLYLETGSPKQIAQKLGLKGSVKGVGKTLRQIAKRLGSASITEFRKDANRPSAAAASQLMQAIKNQQYRCALSGVEISPKTAELDHKTALSEGGSNLIDNLQWLDANVNRAKGTMSQDEFITMCRRVTEWNR